MYSKVVFFYQQASSGWSETWYHPSTDVKTLVNSIITAEVLKAASVFRSELTYLTATRATLVGGSKQSFLRRYVNAYQGKRIGAAGIEPDVVSTDAVIRINGVQTGNRRIFIRGLNDNDVLRKYDGTDEPSGALIAGVINYQNAMQAAGFAIRLLDQPPTGGQSWYPVIKVAKVAGVIPHSDVITQDPIAGPIAAGTTVRFSRVPFDFLPGFPTKATVLQVNPNGLNGVRINYYLREQADYFPPAMQLTGVSYSLSNIERLFVFTSNLGALQFERFSEHKTGRPFGLLRGRARSKVHAL